VLLKLRHRNVDPSTTPLVMGILNVTPDSFSDGGEYLAPVDAVARALAMIAEGADIVDVGPESTRPGAEPVSTAEQIARAIPVIEALRAQDSRVVISIDTRRASVAQAALDAGADMVNDISALRDDPAMADCVAASGAAVVLMHMRGIPNDMQVGGGPHYDDVVGEIAGFLQERRGYAVRCGIDPARIIFDPGIGFGKRVEHNLLIMQQLEKLVALGQPLMVGASRKSFIGHVLGIEDAKRRAAGSLACAAMAVMAGALIIRTHDVRGTVEAVRICAAVRQARSD
jgi:dihydropteroate synthase